MNEYYLNNYSRSRGENPYSAALWLSIEWARIARMSGKREDKHSKEFSAKHNELSLHMQTYIVNARTPEDLRQKFFQMRKTIIKDFHKSTSGTKDAYGMCGAELDKVINKFLIQE